MFEPRILFYRKWFLANQWHYIWGVSDRVWFNLQEYECHSDAIHEVPEVYRRPESLVSRVIFELAYQRCFCYVPTTALMPRVDDGPTASFSEWTRLASSRENGDPLQILAA